MQKVEGESSYWDMVDMLFFYQSSRECNSEFPGEIPRPRPLMTAQTMMY